MAAKRHSMPTVAVFVATPLSVCLTRQEPRPDNRCVPEDVVRSQHQAMTYSHQRLAVEGFNTIVFADTLHWQAQQKGSDRHPDLDAYDAAHRTTAAVAMAVAMAS